MQYFQIFPCSDAGCEGGTHGLDGLAAAVSDNFYIEQRVFIRRRGGTDSSVLAFRLDEPDLDDVVVVVIQPGLENQQNDKDE